MYNTDVSIIKSADIKVPAENMLRRKILSIYRGYGLNSEMFENFPHIYKWLSATCEKADMAKIKYINYAYWNELSDKSSSPIYAAESIKNNKTVFGVSNANFISGTEYLKSGSEFLPVILITDESEKRYIILEGHSRMTVYALAPEYFEGTECMIGYCEPEELIQWNNEI